MSLVEDVGCVACLPHRTGVRGETEGVAVSGACLGLRSTSGSCCEGAGWCLRDTGPQMPGVSRSLVWASLTLSTRRAQILLVCFAGGQVCALPRPLQLGVRKIQVKMQSQTLGDWESLGKSLLASVSPSAKQA